MNTNEVPTFKATPCLPGLSGEALLESLYTAVLIADMEGRIVTSNRRALDWLKFTSAELPGQLLSDVVLGLQPAHFQTIREQSAAGRCTVLEARCRKKDGSQETAEVAANCLPLATGRGWCFSLRPLGPRTTAQQRLQREHNALQSTACALALVDLKGRISYVNPAFARLWDVARPADLTDQAADAVWGAATVQRWLACAQARQRWVGELALLRNGQPLQVEVTAAPHVDEQEHLVGLVLSFVNVTQRKQALETIRQEAEQQLRMAREQKDFAGQLRIIAIPDLVQLIDSSTKSGQLEILRSADSQSAMLTFRAGQLIRAVCGELQGAEAFYAVLRFGGDAFRFRQDVLDEPDPTITQSTMSLLLEGMRRLDEAQRTPAA